MYGKLIAKHVLPADNILDTMVRGPNSHVFFEIVDRHLHAALDQEAGYIGGLVAQFAVGPQHYSCMRRDFIDALNEGLPHAMKSAEGYTGK